MNHCDHNHETTEEIRVLPLGGEANLLVCRAHWKHELNFRKKALKAAGPNDLPEWEALRVDQKEIPSLPIIFSAEEFQSRQRVYIQVVDLTEFFKADDHAWVSCVDEDQKPMVVRKGNLSKLQLVPSV